MAIARFAQKGVEVAFDPPCRLDALMTALGGAVHEPCGGRGTCGKCRVRVAGAVSAPNAVERRWLSEDEIAQGVRLACQAIAEGDCVITPELRGAARVLTEGIDAGVQLSPWGEGLGLAVDIGTTTLAGYLFDLVDGRRLAVASRVNPQAAHGADVISRLDASLSGQGEALQTVMLDALGDLTAALCVQAGREAEAIGAAVLAGNTAMLYLLCGRDVGSIARAPFVVEEPFGHCVDIRVPGLPAAAKVYLPRCIGAYVGADITMAMMAVGMGSGRAAGEAALLLDIGTNGEMVLAVQGRLLACSTAAGPAFEGAGIAQGMAAQDGAVSRVWLEGGTMRCEVIGGGEARGICGSGLLDAVAVLLEAGVIDETGAMETAGHGFADCMAELRGQTAFRLPGCGVMVTQEDVRAVQLAKAAIHAGILSLLEAGGVSCAEVGCVWMAGGFGNALDAESAERIGMLPPGFAKLAVPVGNAAGMGACQVLLSSAAGVEAERAAQACEVVELATNPTFMAQFIEQMMFP